MTELPSSVLVVEDDTSIKKMLSGILTENGYRALDAKSGAEALALARAHNPDLILLDLGLPDLDGSEVARQLREWSSAPIIVVSGRDGEEEKIRVLDIGADDYIVKPFAHGELLARMRSALRRKDRRDKLPGDVLTAGTLKLDLERRQVFVEDREVHLTPIEYKLFSIMMKNAGRVLPHTRLLGEVWGPAYVTQTQYLRVYMVQLRHKLEKEPARPRWIVTEPGVGYRLRTED